MRHAPEHFVQLEQRQLLAADLSISVVDNLPDFVVPGDKITLVATISNQGDEVFKGPATVRFMAPSIDAEDPMHEVAAVGATIDVGDAADADPGNNESWLDGVFDLKLLFGNFGNRRNVIMTATDDDGSVIAYSLKGPGYAEFTSGDGDSLTTLRFQDTTTSSIATMAVKGGDGLVDTELDISVDGSLKSFFAPKVNFSGSLNLLGTLGALTTGDLTDFDLGVGSSGAAMVMKMGNVANGRVSSVTPILSMDVTSWQWLSDPNNPDAPEDSLSRITAPWMGRLLSRGDFSAITTMTGTNAPRLTINTATIGGTFSGEMIALGNVGAFKAASIDGGLLLASGVVSSFTTTNAVEATLWAGTVTRVEVTTATNLEVGAGATFTSDDMDAISSGNGGAVGWAAGSIGDIRIKGEVGRARFAAGVNPVNGTLLDEDDMPGGNGMIGRVEIRGQAQDVMFAAMTLPLRAKIGGVSLLTADDARFLLLEPVS